ncbi:MAG: hypothetical protein C0625_08395 [Arcobacter sp.]|nr:MAG: hypothetical protein C0625_08395 [Arcobacter sp.]
MKNELFDYDNKDIIFISIFILLIGMQHIKLSFFDKLKFLFLIIILSPFLLLYLFIGFIYELYFVCPISSKSF